MPSTAENVEQKDLLNIACVKIKGCNYFGKPCESVF